MTGFFSGVITATVTPFDGDGVNLEEFGKMMEYQIDGGADGLVVLGTTGEPSTMTEDEKVKLLNYAVKKAKGRIKIIIGTGSNNQAAAVKNSILAEKAGADGVLAVTPYYNKCTQNGLINYYKAICDSVKIPVIAYNVPSRTGVNILPETAEKLAAIPNLAGIKEASGNMSQVVETMRAVRGKCDIYSGEDALNLPILAIGGAGVISVVSNIAPKKVKEIFSLVKAGNLEKANEINDQILPLVKACFCEVNPIPVKAAYNMLGFKAGAPRSPLTELEEKHREELKKIITKTGLKGV